MPAGPGHRRLEITAILRSPAVFAALGFAVAWTIQHPSFSSIALDALIVLPAVVCAIRWPLATLVVMVVLVPFSQMTQAWLWWHEWFPADAAIHLGYAKELVVGVALLRAWSHRPRPLERVDWLALALLALVGLYALAPLGPALGVRYVAARANVGFVAVFLAARWLGGSDVLRRRAEMLIPVVAGVVALLGIWNRFGPDGWQSWVDSTGILQFRNDVMNAPTLGAVERVPFGGGEVIRAGSVLFSPNDLGFLLLVVVALIGSRVVRRVSKPWEVAIGVLCTFCIFCTFSRSAMAMFVLVGIVLAAASGRLSRGIGVIYGTGVALLLVFVLLGSGDQLASGANASDQRTQGHIEAIDKATRAIVAHPLGSGLGTTGTLTVRFASDTGFQTENFYLHIGVEVGVIGAVAMVAFIVMVLRMLWRRSRQVGGIAVGALAALAAVATGGLVLETFSELATGWTLWLLVGMALPATPAPSVDDATPGRGQAHGLGLDRERLRGAAPAGLAQSPASFRLGH